jgi:hypothetical protein
MEVYEVSARFMRRIQAKEYEPAEAEVSLKAQLAEGEDSKAAINTLMAQAKEGVKAVLSKSTKGTDEETTTETAKGSGRGGPGKPRKQVLTPKEAPAKEEPEDDDLMGGEDEEEAPKKAAKAPAKAAPAKKAPKKEEPEEEPEDEEEDEFAEGEGDPEEDESDEDEEKAMTWKELQDWITQYIPKKISPTDVRKILGKYGASRTADTKEEDRPKIKRDVEKFIAKGK